MPPEPWRGEYARRFVARAVLRPPWPPVVYVQLTDEEIDALPEELRPYARIRRDLLAAFAVFAESLQRTDTRDGDGVRMKGVQDG